MQSVSDRIKGLFITKKYNPNGVYKIRFFVNGEEVIVTIDDYIPCDKDKVPLFARNQGDELWVMLLEKAYAKLHFKYWNLNDGYLSNSLADLTGGPIETLSFPKNYDKTKKSHREWARKI